LTGTDYEKEAGLNQTDKTLNFWFCEGIDDADEKTKDDKFLKTGMLPYMIFDLNSKP